MCTLPRSARGEEGVHGLLTRRNGGSTNLYGATQGQAYFGVAPKTGKRSWRRIIFTMTDATPAQTPALITPSAAGPLSRLPPMMLQDAAKRTAWLCLSIAVLVPAIQVFQRWMQPELYAATMNDVNRLLSLAMVLWAIGLFALNRYRVVGPSTIDRKSTRLNSSHTMTSRMPSSA